MPLLVYLWSQLILIVWWAAYWPALMSYDSLSYVTHVTVGPWIANHSVVYDTMVLVSLKLCDSVWLLTLVQTVAYSAAIAYFAVAVRAWGVRGRWVAIPALVLPLIPSYGAFVVTMWKDVPFALCELLVAASMLDLIRVWRVPPKKGKDSPEIAEGAEPPGKPRPPWKLLAAIGAELLGMAVFRLDGFPMIVVIVIVAVVALRGLRIRLIAVGAAAIAVFAIANTVIYPAAGIKTPPRALTYVTLYGDIAVVYSKAPHTFTRSDKVLMRQVAPLSTWRSSNNCYSSDSLYQGRGFNYQNAAKMESKMLKLWFRVLKRTPVAMVKTRLCRGSVAWNPFSASSKRGALAGTPIAVPHDLYNFVRLLPPDLVHHLRHQPLSYRLSKFITSYRLHTSDEPWKTLLWRGALWSYIAYICLVVAGWRLRNWRLLAVSGVCLGNQLMVTAVNPSQLYRYIVAPIFIGILLLPIVLVPRKQPDEAASNVEGEVPEDDATREITAPEASSEGVAPAS
jgi:hypothetical protein